MEGRTMKVCIVCGMAYKQRHQNHWFCSRECYAKGTVVPPREPNGKDFLEWAEEFRPEWIEEWKTRRGL